jgi:hypothetical protein
MGGNLIFPISVSGDVIVKLLFLMSFVLRQALSAFELFSWAMRNIIKAGVLGIYMGNTRSPTMLFLTRISLVVLEYPVPSFPILFLLLLVLLPLVSLAPLLVSAQLRVELLMLRFSCVILAMLPVPMVLCLLLRVRQMAVP